MGLTAPPRPPRAFFDRPYLVPGRSNPGNQIYDKITDPEVKRLPRFVGSVDQVTNVVCVRDWPGRRAALTALYSD